ncbi:MAG: hypothetical protein ABIH84_00185 [bacterium]
MSPTILKIRGNEPLDEVRTRLEETLYDFGVAQEQERAKIVQIIGRYFLELFVKQPKEGATMTVIVGTDQPKTLGCPCAVSQQLGKNALHFYLWGVCVQVGTEERETPRYIGGTDVEFWQD